MSQFKGPWPLTSSLTVCYSCGFAANVQSVLRCRVACRTVCCLVAQRSGRWTHDRKVAGSTPGRVAIKWFLLGRVTLCGQVNHLGT